MKRKKRSLFILLIIALSSIYCLKGSCQSLRSSKSLTDVAGESSNNNYGLDFRSHGDNTEEFYLDYQDLIELSKTPVPQGKLKENLENQLNKAYIVQPTKPEEKFLYGMTLGEFFRVASWNIERGFNVDLIEKVFSSKDLLEEASSHDIDNDELFKELLVLREASVIVLNEVDIGLPRTHYQNIVRKLAQGLNAGYVFGTEFIEVDPYQLGLKKFTNEERLFLEQQALSQLDNIEKEKFKGLHGTAILSKYPILNAKILRLPDCYNWYMEESNKLTALEMVRRGVAKKIFSEKVLTELRHGGRMAIVAELLLPKNNKITVVATHIENRCLPECRYKQLEFLLKSLRFVKGPLILAGDFNTTGSDASPVSVKKEVFKRVKDPAYVARQAIWYLTPLGFVENVILNTTNALRNYKDPTTKHIPIVLPNKERKLFDLLGEYRFNDGGAFDLRGVPEKTHNGYYALLSNSNERGIKGFKPTFELERDLGVAKYKLDWFFVKSLNLKDPKDKNGSYAYAPHFGRTLSSANRAFSGRLSDHDPITVDIPIGEPLR